MPSQQRSEHRLVDDTLVREGDGIVARCVCGWVSRRCFSSLSYEEFSRDFSKTNYSSGRAAMGERSCTGVAHFRCNTGLVQYLPKGNAREAAMDAGVNTKDVFTNLLEFYVNHRGDNR